MSIYLQPNTSTNGRYTGSCYAFGASGGFTVQQGFSEIELTIPDVLQKYDVTNAIQVQFSARTLNKKLSILKDASNLNVVQALYDGDSETLYYDDLKICACEYIDGINTSSIISVGRLQYLYSDFNNCVGNYFGDPGGFASLFSNANEFDVNNGVFDASAYLQVINSSTFSMTGSFVSDLSGHVTISDINKTLEWVVDSNVFNNRDPSGHNYGLVDGFVAGDLIFIPEGFTISLSVDIEPETLLPINNVGPTFLNSIRDKLNWTKGYVKRTTTYSTTNITQTTTVPILLVLTNDTVENYTNFGNSWTIAADISSNGSVTPMDSNNWLSISLSSTGKYQSAIDASGNIYTSNNFGISRTSVFNIGASENNNVAISFSGIHQTASNGHSIYVSSDFGVTWTPTFSNGTSNIFVSISLTGKYQTVVSCGDNVYTSQDYGVTWSSLDMDNELFQSVETFPTAGVALSYNGMYQTIVTENIYISHDFGQTWTNTTSGDFDDRNWQAVSMSSDGKYQSAIENGGDIYTSNDYGLTWTFINDPLITDNRWESISLSATGQYQTALEQYGNIYVSNDYGVTWSMVDDPNVTGKNWQWVSVSSDALYQCAVEYGGKIYMSQILAQTSTGEPCVCD